MKCPLMLKEWKPKPELRQWEPIDCLGEECAWWNTTNGNCGVLQLSKSIYYLGVELAQGVKKMPTELQFRT